MEKVIRELEKGISFGELEKIYAKGHKIAMVFGKDDMLAFDEFIVSDIKGKLENVENQKVKEGLYLEDGGIYAKEDTVVEIDSIFEDKTGYFGNIVVVEEGEYKVNIMLYDDNANGTSLICEKVFEIE